VREKGRNYVAEKETEKFFYWGYLREVLQEVLFKKLMWFFF